MSDKSLKFLHGLCVEEPRRFTLAYQGLLIKFMLLDRMVEDSDIQNDENK